MGRLRFLALLGVPAGLTSVTLGRRLHHCYNEGLPSGRFYHALAFPPHLPQTSGGGGGAWVLVCASSPTYLRKAKTSLGTFGPFLLSLGGLGDSGSTVPP